MKKNNGTVFQSWFKNSPGAVFLMDYQGLLIEANNQAVRQFDISHQQLSQYSIFDLFIWPEKDRELKKTKDAKHIFFEGIHQIRKKNNKPIEINISSVSYEGRNVLLCLFRDITIWHKAKEALHESEEKYGTLIQKIKAAIVVHGSDTRIITSNSMAQELLGLTEDQLMGKSAVDPDWHFFREDGTIMPVEEYPVNMVLTAGQALRNYIVGVHCPDKESDVWVLVNADPVFNKEGEITEVIVTFVDLTKRKLAEEALRNERGLFMSGPTVVFKWKALEGWPVEYVSPNVTDQFGYAPEDFTSDKVRYAAIIHPDDVAFVAEEVTAYSKQGMASFRQTYRIACTDGQYRWIEDFTTVIRGRDGVITHYLGYVLDITERKQAENQILKLNRIYAVLSNINQVIVRIHDTKEILNETCRIATEYGRFRMAWIGMVNADANKVDVVASNGVSEDYLNSINIDLSDEFRSSGPTGTAIRTGKHKLSNNIADDNSMIPWQDNALRYGYKSSAAFPLIVFNKVIGVFNIYTDEADFFHEDDIKLLDEMAKDISFALEFIETENKRKLAEEAMQKAHEELKRTLRIKEAFLSAIPIPVFYKDKEGRYLGCNSAFSEFMGVSSDQIKGKTVYELWPGERAEVYHGKDMEFMRNPERQIYESRTQDKDGIERPVICSNDVFRDENDDIAGLVGAFMDISDRKQVEEALHRAHDKMEEQVEQRTAELKKMNERLAALYKVGQAITAPLDLKVVLDVIARSTAKLLGTDTGVILLLDEAGEFLTIQGAYGIRKSVVNGTRDRVGESIAGRVVQTGKPIIANDLPNDPRFYNPSAVDESLLACASVPLITGGKIIGTLDIHSKTNRQAFDEEHIHILNMLASQAAIAIENARLYEQIQQARDELEVRVLQRTTELVNTNTKLQQGIFELKRAEEALWESSQMLKVVLNNMPSFMFWKDRNSVYLGCNILFAANAGLHSPEEIIGKTDFDLPWKPAESESYRNDDKAVMETGIPKFNFEETQYTADGRDTWVRTSKIPLKNVDDKIIGVLGTFEDITERRRAEIEITRVNRSLRMLSDSNQALIHITDEVTLLNEVCRISVEVGGFPIAWVGFTEDAENRTIKVMAHAGPDLSYIETVREKWPDHIIENSPTTKAICTGKPYIIPDILSDPFFTTWRETVTELGVKSYIALPLIGESRTLGVLNIFAGESDAFDEREVEILAELADDLAFGIIAIRAQATRDKTEEALQKSETLYRTIINTIHDVFYRTDEQGILLMASPSILPLLGYDTLDEIIGHPIILLWKHPEKRNDMLDRIAKDGLVNDYEVEMKKKDDTPVFVSVSTSFIFDEVGKIAGVQGVFRDITKRQKAEEDLRQSEERYRLIADNTADTIVVFDMNIKPLYVSPSILKLRGFTVQEAITQSLDQILAPESLQKAINLFDEEMAFEATGKADPSRTFLLELEEYCNDGSIIWVEVMISFLRDSYLKPIGILTVTRDITERKKAEKIQAIIYRMSVAAQTVPNLEKLFGSIHTMIAELMPARNFYISLFNKTTKEISFPYYVDEFDTTPPATKLGLGLTDYVLRTGKPLLATKQVFEQLVESGHIEIIGTPSVTWLGVPLRTQRGETLGVMAVQTYTEDIHLDATHENILEFVSTQVSMAIQHKWAEEALHRSEEKYRNLVENLSEVIFTLDTQGCFTYISPAIEHYTGFLSNQVIGMPFTRFIHPDDLAGLESSFERSLTGQLESYEFRVLNNDGTVRHVRTSSRQLMEEGKLAGLTGIMSDITERRKGEEELLKAKEKAEESNRLKSAFLATMNHELRTPLNHILGFSDLMRSGAILENIVDYSDIIYKSSQNLLEIIEGIFELALAEQSEIKLKIHTFKCLDLLLSNKSVLNEILEISGKKDQIELVFNADKQLLLQNISTDRNKINQVLLNLFKNAVKFTKTGKIEFGLKTEEPGWLVLYVSDTGIGIPEEKHIIIFEFFRQVDDSNTREYGGVGIGLAISKKIAEVMNGTLSLKSEPGIGSTFYFKIPVEMGYFRNAQMNDNKKDVSFPTLEGKTILIAEDDPASMLLIKKYLAITGVQLIETVNGKEAIDNLDKNPDLILMDLKMPIVDGYTATRVIKSQRPDIPIIAITAYALSSDENKATEAGCDGIISKPVDQQILFGELLKYI